MPRWGSKCSKTNAEKSSPPKKSSQSGYRAPAPTLHPPALSRACSPSSAPALTRACLCCSRARLLAPARARGVCLVLPGPFCAPCSDVQVSALPQAAMMEANQSGPMKTILVVTAAFGAQNHSALFPPHAPYNLSNAVACPLQAGRIRRHPGHASAGPGASAQGVVRCG